ncbi:hypothetical protein B1748_29415 [Paenibacillus sp. MY03]|jgi:YhcN/YlaJ family sporulation lipoprotein|uniref:Lipoprotein n=1 Tax=Paenibacillus agaridevorans TaxID=171404 RepID=A0A2R5F1P0_9BACL|nr:MULTISPECIES: YhcN/YlaJ family sporulation lipoprotein [Paenibacillus]OUS70083.1 hypothetical protein B1748_29415 [Paenibacillus sp. MY03]GBG11408.1 hypothetical protein PAT3040_06224 [Paenibacillus agaridevorans]
MIIRSRGAWTLLTACIVLGGMLGGCSMEKQGDLGNKNLRTNEVRYDANGNRLLTDKRFADDQKNEMNRVNGRRLSSNNLVGTHRNYRLEIKPEFGEKLVQEVAGIHHAVVMLADYNAYVAVSLDKEASGDGIGTLSRTYMGLSGAKGTEAGRRIGTLSTGQERLNDELTEKVSSALKAMRPNIELVYVSANPDFVGRMNAYQNDSLQGFPVQHYIMEFNGMVERIFPPRTTKSSDELIRPYGHRFSGRLLE